MESKERKDYKSWTTRYLFFYFMKWKRTFWGWKREMEMSKRWRWEREKGWTWMLEQKVSRREKRDTSSKTIFFFSPPLNISRHLFFSLLTFAKIQFNSYLLFFIHYFHCINPCLFLSVSNNYYYTLTKRYTPTRTELINLQWRRGGGQVWIYFLCLSFDLGTSVPILVVDSSSNFYLSSSLLRHSCRIIYNILNQ